MVVGGEEGAGTGLGCLVQVFHDGPGNGDAVIGRGATAQLVEEHERARRDVVQDVRGLRHLDHERRFAQRDIVRRSHTGEDFVHQTDSRGLCGHKAAHLGQQYYQCRLTQQRRFAGHVRACDDDDLLTLLVEHDVVGDILLVDGQLRLDDGVAALLDVDGVALVDDGTDVAVLLGSLGKAEQAVETGE